MEPVLKIIIYLHHPQRVFLLRQENVESYKRYEKGVYYEALIIQDEAIVLLKELKFS